MGRDWKKYKDSRRKTVELPGGFTVIIRQPDLRRVLATAPLEPAAIARYTVMRAAGMIKDDPLPAVTTADLHNRRRSKEDIALGEARLADIMDLTYSVLCECCVEPRMYLDKAEAEASEEKTGVVGVWVYDLAPEDVGRLEREAFALLNLEVSEARELAPFPEPADAGEAGSGLEPAGPAAAEESTVDAVGTAGEDGLL
jgi:hypothetical protein